MILLLILWFSVLVPRSMLSNIERDLASKSHAELVDIYQETLLESITIEFTLGFYMNTDFIIAFKLACDPVNNPEKFSKLALPIFADHAKRGRLFEIDMALPEISKWSASDAGLVLRQVLLCRKEVSNVILYMPELYFKGISGINFCHLDLDKTIKHLIMHTKSGFEVLVPGGSFFDYIKTNGFWNDDEIRAFLIDPGYIDCVAEKEWLMHYFTERMSESLLSRSYPLFERFICTVRLSEDEYAALTAASTMFMSIALISATGRSRFLRLAFCPQEFDFETWIRVLSLPAGHKALLCPQFLALLSQKINGREPKCLHDALASRPCTEEYFTILSKTPAVLLNFASRDSFTARMHNFNRFFVPDQSPIDTEIFGIPSELKGINIQEFIGHCLTTESCPSHWVNCALLALEESIPDFDTAFKFLELTLKHCMKHDASLINLGFIRCISIEDSQLGFGCLVKWSKALWDADMIEEFSEIVAVMKVPHHFMTNVSANLTASDLQKCDRIFGPATDLEFYRELVASKLVYLFQNQGITRALCREVPFYGQWSAPRIVESLARLWNLHVLSKSSS